MVSHHSRLRPQVVHLRRFQRLRYPRQPRWRQHRWSHVSYARSVVGSAVDSETFKNGGDSHFETHSFVVL